MTEKPNKAAVSAGITAHETSTPQACLWAWAASTHSARKERLQPLPHGEANKKVVHMRLLLNITKPAVIKYGYNMLATLNQFTEKKYFNKDIDSDGKVRQESKNNKGIFYY